ncbi:ankyrin repeat domain-containing protein 13c [Anaeramoeba flamelloides]|uniref:Ankyrin repeat domain-containing protein 13c n=1 Tax=Anaeramoeba flamelloides TaxID=1746091 RepID=A0ABQ8XBV6_9EUKA|nr:ankyrin repeat domain-containing protein 13c [Anaeramoeba flamelloides]
MYSKENSKINPNLDDNKQEVTSFDKRNEKDHNTTTQKNNSVFPNEENNELQKEKEKKKETNKEQEKETYLNKEEEGEKRNQKLLECVSNGDTKYLKQLFKKEKQNQKSNQDPLDLNIRDNKGLNPLLIAIYNDDLRMVKMLLRYGADPLSLSKEGWTLLQEATFYGNRRIIKEIYLAIQLKVHHVYESKLPLLLEQIDLVPDFMMKIHWEINSWLPFIEKFLPSDEYLIWKTDSNIRVDCTLIGFENRNWVRGNVSLLLTGLKTETPGDVFIIDHDNGTYLNTSKEIKKGRENIRVTQNDIDFLMENDMVKSTINTSNCKFQKKKSWFADRKTQKIGNWNAKVYEVKNLLYEGTIRQVVRPPKKKGNQKKNNKQDQRSKKDRVEKFSEKEKKAYDNFLKKQKSNKPTRKHERKKGKKHNRKENRKKIFSETEKERRKKIFSETERERRERKRKQNKKENESENEKEKETEKDNEKGNEIDDLNKIKKETETETETETGRERDAKENGTKEKKEKGKEKEKVEEKKKTRGKKTLTTSRSQKITSNNHDSTKKKKMKKKKSYGHLPKFNIIKKTKNFSGTVCCSRDFPLTIEKIIPIFEALAPLNQQFEKLKDFICLKLPFQGFPIQMEVPVFPGISAIATFTHFQEMDPDPELFQIPKGYQETTSYENYRSEIKNKNKQSEKNSIKPIKPIKPIRPIHKINQKSHIKKKKKYKKYKYPNNIRANRKNDPLAKRYKSANELTVRDRKKNKIKNEKNNNHNNHNNNNNGIGNSNNKSKNKNKIIRKKKIRTPTKSRKSEKLKEKKQNGNSEETQKLLSKSNSNQNLRKKNNNNIKK